MSEWENLLWGDIITLEYGKSLKKNDRVKGRHQVFGSNGPIGWSEKKLTEGPGVILGRKGAYRGIEYSEKDFWVIDTAYYAKLKREIDMRWLYYAMKGYKLGEIDDGSPIPSTPRAFVYKEKLSLPPLPEQKAIAKILADLDDKIELNRKMNQTLEEMAQALFKSWFVNFDPVLDNSLATGNEIPEALQTKAAKRKAVPEAKKLLHTNPALAESFPSSFVFNEELEKWIPAGWEVKMIKDFGEVVCGKTPAKSNSENYGGSIPFIKIPFMHHDVYVLETDEYISDEGKAKQQNKLIPSNAICVSCIATVGKVVITHEDCFTNQQVNSIIPFDHDREYYLYFKMLEMERTFHDLASGGSATLNMNTRTFSNINLLSPSDNLLNLFHERVSGSFEKILLQLKQNQTLSKQRDVLLPQLISGKLRVTENGKKRNSKTEKEPV